jgi:DNA-binding NarL/FixJ family response regulator
MARPRVLLADDHQLLLGALEKLLAPECEIVGTASDGRSLVAEAQRLKPDVVVLDIAMPLLNGLDAGRQIKQLRADVKLIFVTMNEDSTLAVKAFRAGASAYLLKRSAAPELLLAVREVMAGRSYVTPLVAGGLVRSLIDAADRITPHELTARQREVLQLLVEGHSMKQVAALLNVTPRTVAFHKYRMMEQLNIRSNAELIQFAIANHIV